MFRIEDKMKLKLLPASEHRVGGELVTHGCDLWLSNLAFQCQREVLRSHSQLIPYAFHLLPVFHWCRLFIPPPLRTIDVPHT